MSGVNESVTVPFGSFTNCLKTDETTPLEPDAFENKFYVSGVGLVLSIDEENGEQLALLRVTTE